jgi:hypothetical protein
LHNKNRKEESTSRKEKKEKIDYTIKQKNKKCSIPHPSRENKKSMSRPKKNIAHPDKDKK